MRTRTRKEEADGSGGISLDPLTIEPTVPLLENHQVLNRDDDDVIAAAHAQRYDAVTRE